MDMTIIGTGKMAHGIGMRAVVAGYRVTLHARHSAKGEALAARLGAGTRVEPIGAPPAGQIVVLAVPYGALPDLLARYGLLFRGKTLVDITNPVDDATFEPIRPAAGSAAEEIAALRPEARVVKAFNTTFSSTLIRGEVEGLTLDVFIAADDAEAKRDVAHFVEQAALRAIDVGRCVAPASSRPWATCTSRCRRRCAQTTPAPSRSSAATASGGDVPAGAATATALLRAARVRPPRRRRRPRRGRRRP